MSERITTSVDIMLADAERIDDLEQRLAVAEMELKQYQTKGLLCWDRENPENGSYDEQGIAEFFADNMCDNESRTYCVMRALSLPDREMIVTLSGGEERKMMWEWVKPQSRR